MVQPVDLLIENAWLIATMDVERREIAGGWLAIHNGYVVAVGEVSDPAPDAKCSIDASGCLVTPGLINTHHHLFQNLTRSYGPMTSAPLFGWLQSLYPLWTAASLPGPETCFRGNFSRGGVRRRSVRKKEQVWPTRQELSN